MSASPDPPRPRHRQIVPTDVYISLVDSLFGDARTFGLGAVAAIMAILFTAWRTGEPLLYADALLVAVVSSVRVLDMRRFTQIRPALKTAEEARHWELRYIVSASIHVALLGTWVLISFAKTSDPAVQLLSFTASLAFLVGIPGRNFASDRVVIAQIVSAGLPMSIALILLGGGYLVVLGLVLLPFLTSVKFISERVRRILLDAVIATQDVTALAIRFDTALNNMPHGLCMFDNDGRLAISNRRFTEILNLSPEVVRRGANATEILKEAVRSKILAASRLDRLASDFDHRLLGHDGGSLEVELENDRTIVLTFQPMKSGGSVVLFEDITERRIAEAKINHLARYDALTGLPNRTLLHDQMELALAKAKRTKEACAALFIDLDQFKQINDTMGHPFGDDLLCAVAERLRGIVRGSDILARFGGDEFIILLSPMKRPEEAASMARRVVEVLSETFDIDGHYVLIGASVGIAVAPQDGTDADLLLKNADMALYRTKSEGRGSWRFFEREMDVRAQARRNLEIDIRNAVASNAFRLFYQPQINLKTKRISTCEALLRWPHPERGMISPAEFIPIAEEMGLIVEIGNWVLREACGECMKWPVETRVSVNLSPIQFRRGNVADVIREALSASGRPANRLEIEITETVLLQDTEATRAQLAQLREMGVRISLDDFGTGYSSLSYLHSFPLDKVKIDRSFLQGIGASGRSIILLRGVARLSAELGLSVVVEGVETEEELALITSEASVDEAQGYLFSPAVPGRVIQRLLVAAPRAAIRVA